MDQLKPFQVFFLEKLDFAPNSFEVYQKGRLINQGLTSMKIKVRTDNKNAVCQNNIKVSIENNNLSNILESTAFFDIVTTLQDRFIALILPKQSNINDMIFNIFKYAINCTRDEKHFKDKEPLCMSMFTENGNVVKMSFKVYSPETLVELSL